MNRYILLSFLFMGWTFYVLSGGSDFVPPSPDRTADADEIPKAKPEPEVVKATLPEPVSKPEPAMVPQTTAKLDLVMAPEPEAIIIASVEDAAPVTTESDATESEPTGIVMPTGWANDFQNQSNGVDTTYSLLSLAQIANAAPQDTTGGTRTIKGSAVNVRSGPGTDHSVVTRLTGGTEVQVINDPGEGWVEMRHGQSDTVGWVAASLLSP